MRKLNLLLIFLAITIYSYGQGDRLKLRHIKGMKAIEAGHGTMFGNDKLTNTSFIGYNQFLNKKLFFGVSGNYEYGKIGNSSVGNVYGRFTLNHTVYSINDVAFFNLGYGAFLGSESSKSTIEGISGSSVKGFYYGGLATLSIEIFASNLVAIVPFYNQFYQLSSELGNATYNLGLSIKFNFN